MQPGMLARTPEAVALGNPIPDRKQDKEPDHGFAGQLIGRHHEDDTNETVQTTAARFTMLL
jgi:hypothetical protein